MAVAVDVAVLELLCSAPSALQHKLLPVGPIQGSLTPACTMYTLVEVFGWRFDRFLGGRFSEPPLTTIDARIRAVGRMDHASRTSSSISSGSVGTTNQCR